MCSNNEKELAENAQCYYDKSLDISNEFGGPSLYFHTQAIAEQKERFLSERHTEMIYATLSSWGMHRMGDSSTKTKMVEFGAFKKSIESQRDPLARILPCKMHNCTLTEFADYIDSLHDVFFSLRVSISNALAVAHSKTLAHLLPDFIPPIDRQYTVRFFTQDKESFFIKKENKWKYRDVKDLPRDHEEQFALFKNYCCRIKQMLDGCDRSRFRLIPNSFNTSFPKIMDNMIVAFVKAVPRPQ